jgi:hypothetical protein
MKIGVRLFFVTLVCVACIPLASPATCGFVSPLNVTETAGTTGPFGDVCVNLESATTALITFTAAPTYTFVDSSIADVQVNAATFTASFSSDTTSSSPSAGSGNVNGYGSFNLTWDNGAASNHEDFFSFLVTNTSGSWGLASDVLTANAKGFDAAAHVLCLQGSGCETAGTDGTPLTFFVAEGATSAVPEPRFYGLLLIGLMGVAAIMFRRRQAA